MGGGPWLAVGHRGHLHFKRGLFGLFGDAIGCFEQPTVDPLLDQLDLGRHERIALRRHEGLGHLGDRLEDAAVARRAADRHLAGQSPGHGGVAHRSRPALFLVGIVAVVALTFKNRPDMILEGDFLVGSHGEAGTGQQRAALDGTEERGAGRVPESHAFSKKTEEGGAGGSGTALGRITASSRLHTGN